MKRLFIRFLIMILVVCMSGCGETENIVSSVPTQSQPISSQPETVKTQSKIEDRVRTLGRTNIAREGIWLSWSGSGIEFEFEGSSATVSLVGTLVFGESHQVLMGVFVDGSATAKKTFTVSDKGQTVTLCEKLKSGKHTVKLLKLSEAQYGSVCIKDVTADKMKPTENKKLTFEFIGDSIVCGNGTRAKSSRGEFKTAEQDVSLTMGYLLAEQYKADARFISATNYGIEKFTSGGKLMYDIYGYHAPFLADQVGVGAGEYTSIAPADMIFINLGNDRADKITTDEQRQYFTAEYVKLISFIREKNPDAEIFILCGTATYLLENEIKAAYEYLKEDKKLHYFRYSFESLLVYSGVSAGFPSAHSNQRMYKELLKEMKKLGFKP
ncbi:MAG: hypothetical protein IJ462_03285 [Clostridia bacterium]|nr:hypothetical protein [Clostridia bacterium]